MELNKKKALGGNLALLTAAFIWGTSFVAQSVGMESVEGFTFNGIRMLLGSAALIPLIVFLQLKKAKTDTRTKEEKKKQGFVQFKCGIICGIILFCKQFTAVCVQLHFVRQNRFYYRALHAACSCFRSVP